MQSTDEDATNAAIRDWVTEVETTHYVIGSVVGPRPYPTLVRELQSVIGREARAQALARWGELPAAAVACVGGGSNAIGLFHAFLDDPVALYGVEAAGEGLDRRHAATLGRGRPGVLHGARTGNLTPAHLARAAVEGATLGLAYGLRRFRELGLEPSEVRLTGGGSKSPAWRQVAADAFGVPVVALATAEGAGLGAAIQAAYAYFRSVGQEVGYDELCTLCVDIDESTRRAPDRGASALYAAQLDRQLELTRVLNRGGLL